MAAHTDSAEDNNLAHLKECERLLMRKIRELPITEDRGVNTYHGTLERHFANVNQMRKQRLDQGGDWVGIQAKCVTQSLKELWVLKAGKESTYKIFEDFESFEKVLFQSPDYRGHYVHQFDVFLLGYYVLNRILALDGVASNNALSAEFRRYSNSPNFTWMLAATFHDMGYPIEQIDRWFSTFLKMFLKVDTTYPIEPEKLFSPSFYEYLRFLSEQQYSTIQARPGESYRDWRFHELLQTSLKKKDHGVVSSLLLIHSLLTQEKITQDYVWFISDFRHLIIPACHAIATHNLFFANQEISLAKYPYAFLLILCDTLQDWERCLEGKDYSELKDMTFNSTSVPPEVTFKLAINSKEKTDEIVRLQSKLSTDKLIRVKINDERGKTICEF